MAEQTILFLRRGTGEQKDRTKVNQSTAEQSLRLEFHVQHLGLIVGSGYGSQGSAAAWHLLPHFDNTWPLSGLFWLLAAVPCRFSQLQLPGVLAPSLASFSYLYALPSRRLPKGS